MICAIDKQTRAEEEPTAQAEIVFTLDLAGNFKFVNAAGERLSGYSCEEARRLNVADVVVPELTDYVQQILATIGRRFGGVYEIEIITKDRRRLVLETSAHLVNRNGRPIEIHGIALSPMNPRRSSGNVSPRCLDARFSFVF